MNSPSWMCYSKLVRQLQEATSEVLLVDEATSARRGFRQVLTKSVPHTPQAFTFTRTSSSRSSGRGISTMEKFSGLEYLDAAWSA